jgi:hypothetical protein
MPLPTGDWKANVNGVAVDLVINAPNAEGVFDGTLGDVQIRGFWDESSQTISFGLILPTHLPVAPIAMYTASLLRSPAPAAPGQDVTVTLSGSMRTTPDWPGSSARRNVFGWFAQITEIV